MSKVIDKLIDENINMASDIGKMLDKNNKDLENITNTQQKIDSDFFYINHYVSRLSNFFYRAFGSSKESKINDEKKLDNNEVLVNNEMLDNNEILEKEKKSFNDTGHKNEGILKSKVMMQNIIFTE